MKSYGLLVFVIVMAGVGWYLLERDFESPGAGPSPSTPTAPAKTRVVENSPRTANFAEPATSPKNERSATSMTVRISGLRESGQVHLALFDAPDGFPKNDRAARTLTTDGSDGRAELIFDAMHEGVYAIAVFQDLNADGVLNRGAFGAPTEPYGFSNNARGSFGPPSFQKASFRFPLTEPAIEIHVK